MDITYKDAIQRVCTELQADPQLFYAFQANIAMPLCDELVRSEAIKPDKFDAVHELVSKAAINFLNLLCNDSYAPPTNALSRISQERWKQIYRYGYDAMHDEYADGELVQAALFSIDPDNNFAHLWPNGWGSEAKQRIIDRSKID